MKKRFAYFLVGAVCFGYVACTPDTPSTFSAQDGLYFNAGADSVVYTFAKFPNRTVDTVKVPIAVLGKSSSADREITIMSVPGADINAVEGTHYKMLKPYIIPANSVSASIPILVYRTGDLDSITASLRLQIKENLSFGLGITTNSTVKIKVGYLQKPPTWGDLTSLPWAGYSTNFGTWTKTKYKVILDALYNPTGDTTITEFPIGNRVAGQFPAVYTQYLQVVKNYIRTKYPGNYSTPLGVGATLRDTDIPNSPVIQVGPANY
jgi:hypothetical protein